MQIGNASEFPLDGDMDEGLWKTAGSHIILIPTSDNLFPLNLHHCLTWKQFLKLFLKTISNVSNKAPRDLKANLHRAFAHFEQEDMDKFYKPTEFKALLFGLWVFHVLILGRRMFDSQGWSKHYNFNDGALTIWVDALQNYLKNYEQIPYSDLQYIYGEIMYGGYITDDWDRRTNNTYLKVIIQPGLFKAQPLTRAPDFNSPGSNKFDKIRYEKYIEESLPSEIP